jgi:hypothetical protein
VLKPQNERGTRLARALPRGAHMQARSTRMPRTCCKQAAGAAWLMRHAHGHCRRMHATLLQIYRVLEHPTGARQATAGSPGPAGH